MKAVLPTMLVVLALGLSGCPTSGLSDTVSASNQKLEAQGLPFRWSIQGSGESETMVMRKLPLPVAPTRADAHTAQEIMSAIRAKEQGKGRASVELQEVQQMQDGREVWILQSIGQGTAYVVTLGSPTQGITKIGLLGPYNYSQ